MTAYTRLKAATDEARKAIAKAPRCPVDGCPYLATDQCAMPGCPQRGGR